MSATYKLLTELVQQNYNGQCALESPRLRATVLPRLSVPRLTGIQLSGRSILLQQFKIRLLLIRCCRNSFPETLR